MERKTHLADFHQEEKMPFCNCPLGMKAIFFCDQEGEACLGKQKGQIYYCTSCIQHHLHVPKVITVLVSNTAKELFSLFEEIKDIDTNANQKIEKYS